jgi:hypothetical protein
MRQVSSWKKVLHSWSVAGIGSVCSRNKVEQIIIDGLVLAFSRTAEGFTVATGLPEITNKFVNLFGTQTILNF